MTRSYQAQAALDQTQPNLDDELRIRLSALQSRVLCAHSVVPNIREGIVNLGNLLTISPPRTTADLLICGAGGGRARLKIVEICLDLTMPVHGLNSNQARAP
jgi:hypothetical protein